MAVSDSPSEATFTDDIEVQGARVGVDLDAGPAGPAMAVLETPPRLGVKALFGLLTAIGVGYWIFLFIRPNGDGITWLDGWGVASFEFLCSALVIVKGIVSKRDRKWAVLVGLGGVSWALGDYAMTYMSLNNANVPTPALPNYLWAGFFPLAYVGVMLLVQRDVRKLTAANYLDGVVAVLVTAAALVAFAFGSIEHAAQGDALETGTNLIYPVLDLLLSGLTVIGIMLLPKGQRLRWYLMAAAGLVNATGDIAALFPNLTATDIGYILNTGAWPASLLLIALATWIAPGSKKEASESAPSGFLVPGLASGAALLILFVGSIIHTSQVAIGLASMTLLAAGVRFYLALRHMNRLTNAKHEELERAAAAEREFLERAAAAERLAAERAAEAAAAEQESRERAAAAEREFLERAAESAAAERERLEQAAAAEREARETLEAAVRNYSQFASRVAEGDLTATTEAVGDQDLQALGASLNTMVEGLAEISSEMKAGVDDIGISTAEIVMSANEHADRATQQSAAITQTTATIDELREAADSMARRAEDVARGASESVKVSDEGTDALAAIADAMSEIRERVAAIAQEILTLSDRTQQIGDITQTVNDLANRSNLLALNASIEAARAGEHGRGFAVVASQVRSLSEQSKEATARVETILNEVKEATAAAVRASEHGTKVVDESFKLTERAGEGIRSLTLTIRDASDAAEQIAASAQHQSAGMDEISRAMRDLEETTERFLEGAHQSQQAAQNLDDLSIKLAEVTRRYRVAGGTPG